jgi:CheY-like chemotaxis protein
MIATREIHASDDAPEPARRARVLIVDDEPGVLRVLQLVLGRYHDLFTERSAEPAVERIVRGERFDFIFSDLMMPGMDGIRMLKELMRVSPDQAKRLVFLTGGASTPEARVFLATTTHRLIEKPFDADEILGFISSHLDQESSLP